MSQSHPPDGIPCPRCRGTKWTVFSTRHETGRMVRVRTCAGCKLRVRTGEKIEAVLGDAPETPRYDDTGQELPTEDTTHAG